MSCDDVHLKVQVSGDATWAYIFSLFSSVELGMPTGTLLHMAHAYAFHRNFGALLWDMIALQSTQSCLAVELMTTLLK